eukprot:11944391-Alexandrium_andersonii.AAC.1
MRDSRSGIGRTHDRSRLAEAPWPGRTRGRWVQHRVAVPVSSEHVEARKRPHPWLLDGGWPRWGGSERRHARRRCLRPSATNRNHYGSSWPKLE